MNSIKSKEKEQLIKSKLCVTSTLEEIIDTYLQAEGVLFYNSKELIQLVKNASKLYGNINTALQLEFDGMYNSVGKEGNRLFADNSFRSENGGFIQIISETDRILWLVYKVSKNSPIVSFKEIDIIGVAISAIREDSNYWSFINDWKYNQGVEESVEFLFTSNLNSGHIVDFQQQATFGFFDFTESTVTVDGFSVSVTESMKY